MTASSAMPIGTRLGEFEITGVIGEGGFGIVYSARDSSLDRIVAIKEYLPSAFASRTTAGTVQVRSQEHNKTFEAGLSSFINEARMLAKFSHPGLVEVFRFWEANGTAYMAMRYYRGVTLREMLRTNPQVVTEQWLCETLDPILLALQELHNEKCYHRDIAPDNILVLPNGRSVLMDFGAARRIIGGMTRALTTVLKPGYAPIEQYSDDGSMAQGAWTDVYAVGGLLYHAMTGKVPVQAISRMMNDPLKPVSVAARAEFSPNLCAVVMKCLAVMPENRYQSVDELRAALGWMTTPVSSTVMFQRTPETTMPRTTMAPPPVPPVSAPVAAPLVQPVAVPRVAPAAADLLGSTGTKAGEKDALADLLGPTPSSPSAPPVARDAKVTAKKLPAAERTPPAKAASNEKSADAPQSKKTGVLPMVVVGIAVLAVLGSAAYLLMAGGDSVTPARVDGPSVKPAPPIEAKPEPAPAPPPPVAADAPVPSPVSPPAPAPIEPSPNVANPNVAPVIGVQPGGEKPADTAVLGKVDLRIKPWGNISVDGVAKGASPPTMSLQLSPGTHTIEIQNPAGPTVTKTVEVIPGKATVVRHSF
jgi:serine/threonine protein kinase